jgi:hypothetical protein
MERDRSRSGEPVRRAEERGRWRDASQRDREQAEVAGDRMEAERVERDRAERERMARDRADREGWERERRERGELMGRGGSGYLATRDPLLATHYDFMRQFMREMSECSRVGVPARPGPVRVPEHGKSGHVLRRFAIPGTHPGSLDALGMASHRSRRAGRTDGRSGPSFPESHAGCEGSSGGKRSGDRRRAAGGPEAGARGVLRERVELTATSPGASRSHRG